MVARVREFDFDDVSKRIDDLISSTAATIGAKTFTTVKKMKEIGPEFISNNSVYEQLDQ